MTTVAPDDVTMTTVAPDDAPRHFSAGVVVALTGMCLINVTALVVNLSVLVVIASSSQLRAQLTYLFVINLCVVDLLNALVTLPPAVTSFALDRWVFGGSGAVCGVYSLVSTCLLCASVLSVSVISIERYYSITHPMHYAAHMTLRRALAALAYVWLQSLGLALLPVLLAPSAAVYRPSRAYCSSWAGAGLVYVLVLTVLAFLLPAALMLLMYTAVYRVARKAATQVHPQPSLTQHLGPERRLRPALGTSSSAVIHYDVEENPRDGISTITAPHSTIMVPHSTTRSVPPVISVDGVKCQRSKSQLIDLNLLPSSSSSQAGPGSPRAPAARGRRGHWKAAQTLLLIEAVFLLLWTPFFAVHVHGAATGHVGHVLDLVTSWMAFTSYALNPFIYGWFNRSVREALSALLDQLRGALFPQPPAPDTDLTAHEDFFQFLERTSTTRTTSMSRPKPGPAATPTLDSGSAG